MTGNSLFELAYCKVDEWDEQTLSDFYSTYPVLTGSFHEVLLVYEYPQVVITPSSIYKKDDTSLLMHSIQGDPSNSYICADEVKEKELFTVYALPKNTHSWISGKFPSGKYWHHHSLAIKRIGAGSPSGSIHVDFCPTDFTVLAEKNGKLLLAETFPYNTPDDVLFYLLKLCHQLSLSQQETRISLTGLIDRQSALYKELHQYFLHISFREAIWQMPREDYPPHFFTSFNDLARCAS
jgi:hypothetical protein